jgi:DNA polymerase (family X)
MDSRSAAHVLSEIADLLELRAENRFKTRAYRGAAKAVLGLDTDDLTPMLRSGQLAKVKGVGSATIAVITDLVENGESRYLEQLRMNVPDGLLEMMRVPGLSPEKVQQIHDTLGVASIDDLEVAARDGRLAKVKGFGEKTVERLVDAIAFKRRTHALVLFPRAHADAALLLSSVRRHPDVISAEVAGTVRRRCEAVRDIDIVAAVRGDPNSVAASFARVPGVADASVAAGSASIRYVDGTMLDLYCVPEDDFAVAFWRATGSTAHVTQMKSLLAAVGFTLDGNVVRDARGERVPVPTEEALYALADLAYVPPELREGEGELTAATGALPRLVTAGDIRGVLHCHSTYSDGHATIADMAEAARARGWTYLGISDHSQSAFYAGGLRPDDVARQHDEIDALNATLTDFRVLKGIEADILGSGQLDYDDATLDRFDFVIGSVHSRFRMTESEMTTRILTALDDPRLTILGHPTGRLLLVREPYPVDMVAVIEKAADVGIAMELNADPHRLDLEWRHCRRAKALGVPIEIGPDAHSTIGLDVISIGVDMARKGWLEADDILNARSAADVLTFAKARRANGTAAPGAAPMNIRRTAETDPDADIPF